MAFNMALVKSLNCVQLKSPWKFYSGHARSVRKAGGLFKRLVGLHGPIFSKAATENNSLYEWKSSTLIDEARFTIVRSRQLICLSLTEFKPMQVPSSNYHPVSTS